MKTTRTRGSPDELTMFSKLDRKWISKETAERRSIKVNISHESQGHAGGLDLVWTWEADWDGWVFAAVGNREEFEDELDLSIKHSYPRLTGCIGIKSSSWRNVGWTHGLSIFSQRTFPSECFRT